jgi:microcystin-dependent protein
MWSTNAAPSGWLICDGTSVSTSTYAALYAVIGYTFGGSGGSMLLPDYRNRFPVGAGDSYVIGGTGGSKDAIVVSHTHTGTTGGQSADHSHTTAFGGFLTPSGGGGSFAGGGSGSSLSTTTGVSNDHNHSFTTASSGSSGTNANLPPYLGIRFIIKT